MAQRESDVITMVPAQGTIERSGAYRADPLWLRMEAFAFDEPGVVLPYTLRLARDNAWSRYYALRVVEEYRKFCYLTCSSLTPLTPSDAVDQAWHLHLVHTRNYWEEFCANTLRQPLHHQPTRGGEAESTKYRELYERTLVAYRDTFGFAPPDDIWPDVDGRFSHARRFCRIDVAAFWLLAKPKWAKH